MTLPLESPLLPMLARRADALPEGDGWLFEPKWDGFRVIAFKDGDAVVLQSRDGKPLTRYFPEVEAALRAQLPERCVLDGELVLIGPRGLDFEALQLRLHPAASRVKLLAAQTPAAVVFWDLLALGDDELTALPFSERRARLLALAAGFAPPVHLTPATLDRALAADWFSRFEGAGLDGVMAKRLEGPYAPNKRVMVKVKHERTCECVVTGFRWHKSGEQAVGSLMLGLYDDAQKLHHVGVVGAFTMAKRKELAAFLAPYRAKTGEHPWSEWADAQDSVANAEAPEGAAPEQAAEAGGKNARSPGADASPAGDNAGSRGADGGTAGEYARSPGADARAVGKSARTLGAEAGTTGKIARSLSSDAQVSGENAQTTGEIARMEDAGAPLGAEGAAKAAPRKPARGQAASRWNPGKSLAWEPLRPELVLEVAYEHMQGLRFRHTAQFRRWRDDKRPAECTFAQLETTPPWELARIFSAKP